MVRLQSAPRLQIIMRSEGSRLGKRSGPFQQCCANSDAYQGGGSLSVIAIANILFRNSSCAEIFCAELEWLSWDQTVMPGSTLMVRFGATIVLTKLWRLPSARYLRPFRLPAPLSDA
jgi:hypothetical protein